jgi:hypothetical protein
MFYGGRTRNCFGKHCEQCDAIFFVPKHFLEKQRFCSIECRGESQQTRLDLICANCSQLFTRPLAKLKLAKHGKHFCSRSCKEEYTTNFGKDFTGLKDGKSIGKKAKNERGRVCEHCGWDAVPEVILVHHIDMNRKNNDESNLKVLCPNCHAIEHLVQTSQGLVLDYSHKPS